MDQATTRVQPGFVLLFTTPVRAGTGDIAALAMGLLPMDAVVSDIANRWRDAAEAHVLGPEFQSGRRLQRHPLGRIALTGAALQPDHADVTLILHVTGVALWEVWLPAPEQDFEEDRWTGWLDVEQPDSLAATVWARLAPQVRAVSGQDGLGRYLAVSVLRLPDTTLDSLLETQSEALVRLLWRDRQTRGLKPEVVAQELARDTCARVGGLSLIGRRSALDLHDLNDETAAEAARLGLAPRSLLPFLVTLEMLVIERAVLQGLHDRLTRTGPGTVDDLLRLRSDVTNGLEEYYGTTLAGTRFGDEVAVQGEEVLGITALFDAVIDRLDMVSFTLTTHAEQRMTMLQFWLTVVFGATEIGFIASGIATWYYDSGLARVLMWTLGATGVSAAVLILALRNRLRD
ncbi:MAG: hypothetical protein ACK414_10605 [Gemmobacter sp.]